MGRVLSHFSVLAFEPVFWASSPADRAGVEDRLRSALVGTADAVHTYTTFGTRPDGDLIVWSSLVYETDDLVSFTALVSELRRTEAREYTSVDAPVHVGIRLDTRTGSE